MTSIVEEVDLSDGDIIDVTFEADVYWEESFDIFKSDFPGIFGDVTWEKILYSDAENREISDYLSANYHMIEHKLKCEFEKYQN